MNCNDFAVLMQFIAISPSKLIFLNIGDLNIVNIVDGFRAMIIALWEQKI